jgi:hypothetical protein
MSITHSFKRAWPSTRYGQPGDDSAIAWGPPAILAGALATGCAVWFYVSRSFAHEMLLPAIATLFFALAAVLAAVAWNRATSQSAISYRDVTGLLVLFGICAAAAVEPDHMVQLLQDKQR